MPGQSQAIPEESWRKALEGIATVPGRLAYLATLRNTNTGAYEHFGLSQRLGTDVVDRLIRRSHARTFQQWLCFSLERQKQEVEDYFSDMEGDRREIVSNWLQTLPYATWVPSEAREVERMLFLKDLERVLESIRADYGVALPDPD